MAIEYSVDASRLLAKRFGEMEVLRPLRVDRFEPGDELAYEMTGVIPAGRAKVTLAVERFVGGGFAGQVYRVQVKAVEPLDGSPGIGGLTVGGTYAMKILVPPSRASRVFRDAIYWAGFQSPFQLQVNPAAARAGALWQKFIRRAAAERLGGELCVVDILATFVDPMIGSCGEISEWIEGRTWRFEVDDHLTRRRCRGDGAPAAKSGSPEYCAKKRFMAQFVRMLHDMGAPELARQYEWSTCKSQPNCLKRRQFDDDPAGGLTAVDFRAGLALLACLPMSPGDFVLIARGLARGRLVQFDRGDVDKLAAYIEARGEAFADMTPALAELRAAESAYRESQVDVTGHHVRLLYDGGLWKSIGRAMVSGWRVAGKIDASAERKISKSFGMFAAFWTLGLLSALSRLAGVALLVGGLLVRLYGDGGSGWRLGWRNALIGAALLLAAPAACLVMRRMLGRKQYRLHYMAMLQPAYFARAVKARIFEMLIGWLRRGRISSARAARLADSPHAALPHLPLAILPAGLHRMLTDWSFAKEKLGYVFVRPVRLYFNAAAREQWLRDMVAEGRRNHMVSDEDAERILSRIGEPFIQKYLKSLAVHVCTLPVTQVVSVSIAVWYWLHHPELGTAELSKRAALILGAFQVTPISPGSLARGLYVLYLVIRERNFKDYNIAVFLGFFKYVGYLAFPIQMAYRYPTLARFMAGHWATGAVHIVPVFGEKGALLEHFVFDLFYNYPLTVRRRMGVLAEHRKKLPRRTWHCPIAVVAAAALLAGIDLLQWRRGGAAPILWDTWKLSIWAPLLAGAAAAAWAGGWATSRRIILGVSTGLAVALVYTGANNAIAAALGAPRDMAHSLWMALWACLIFTILAAIGAIVRELRAPEPHP
jgi:hypothetical protein